MNSKNPVIHYKLRLGLLMTELQLTQSALGRHCSVSKATINLICRYNKWPKTTRINQTVLRPRIECFLRGMGATDEQVLSAFDELFEGALPPHGHAAGALQSHGQTGQSENQEEQEMLLRAQRLTPEARQQFGILRDPFVNEIRDVADVFETPDIRYVRASVRQTALHGGMLAVISESGGGKSVIRKDTQAWVNNGHDEIIVIEPYVVGTSNHSRVGKPLLASDITARVIKTLDPQAKLRITLESRTDQMHAMLRESSKMGHKHVLIIEEAHDLAVPTLKSLKRFYEIEDGFAKLLSIVLIGQTELRRKLSEKNPEVREVVQRCELITLPPLDNHVGEYLAHKFKRVDVDISSVLDAGAVDMIRTVLRRTVNETFGGKKQSVEQSLCYPLAINNLVTRAINLAAEIGAPKVTAELVEAAIKGD
ncbi:ExeA family protein [Comamonas sp.]|uniref:ExeA family protein n=1 Tax=Comamonas sp. TaxID=34028 RepID=UPI0025895573|nr:AAA family ATPase [Comamonas sp.]